MAFLDNFNLEEERKKRERRDYDAFEAKMSNDYDIMPSVKAYAAQSVAEQIQRLPYTNNSVELRNKLDRYRADFGEEFYNEASAAIADFERSAIEFPKTLYKQLTSQYVPGSMYETDALLPENALPEIDKREAEYRAGSDEAVTLSSLLRGYDSANSAVPLDPDEVQKEKDELVQYIKDTYHITGLDHPDSGIDYVEWARKRTDSLEKINYEHADKIQQLEHGMPLKKGYDAYNSLSDDDKLVFYQYLEAYRELMDKAYDSIPRDPDPEAWIKLLEESPSKGEEMDRVKQIAAEMAQRGMLNDDLIYFSQWLTNYYNAEGYREYWSDFTRKHPIAANLANIPIKAVGGITGSVGAIGQVFSNAVSGENKPIDVNSSSQIMTGNANAIASTSREMIKESAPDWAEDFLISAYDIGTSTADSLFAAALNMIVPNSGLVMLGSEAASSAIYDASQRGASAGQALMVGGLAGISEALFEKFSLGKLIDTAKTAPKSFLSLIKSIGANMGVNFSEEAATEISNIISDTLIMQDLSNYNLAVEQYMKDEGLSREEAERKAKWGLAKQIGMAGLYGAIQGSVMGGGAIGIGELNASMLGRQVMQTENGIETLLDIAEKHKSDAAIQDAAAAVRENPSTANVGQLADALQQYTGQHVGTILTYPTQVDAMHKGTFTPPAVTATATHAAVPQNKAAEAPIQTGTSGGDIPFASTASTQGEAVSGPVQQVSRILSNPSVTASQADSIIKSPTLSAAFTQLTGKALDNLTNAEKRRTVQDSAGFTYAPANGTIKTSYQAPPSTLQEGQNGGVPYAGQQAAAQTGRYAGTAGAAGYGYNAGVNVGANQTIGADAGTTNRGDTGRAEPNQEYVVRRGGGVPQNADPGISGQRGVGESYLYQSPNDGQRAEANERFKEGTVDFIRRNVQDSNRQLVEQPNSLMSYVPTAPAMNSNAAQAYTVLQRRGYRAVVCDGFIETNADGVTTVHKDALTTRDGTVYISNQSQLFPFEIYDHESVHCEQIKNSPAYQAYSFEIDRLLNRTSSAYLDWIDTLLNAEEQGDLYVDGENAQIRKSISTSVIFRELSAYLHERVINASNDAARVYSGMFGENWQQAVDAVHQFHNAITQEASGSDGSFFDSGNGGSSDQRDANADAETDSAEYTQAENVQRDQYAKPADQWTAENWNAGEGNTQAENAADTPAKALSQLADSVRRRFGIPITQGRFRERAYGIFKPKQESIKTRVDNALPTICHELGHYLDKKYGFRSKTGIDEAMEASRRMRPGFIDSYEPNARPGEAVAEFLREYLKDRTKAKAEYPTFYEVFENTLAEAHEADSHNNDLQNIRELGDEANQYMMTSPQERAKRAIFTREESVKDLKSQETAFEKVQKIGTTFYNHFVDDAAALKIAPKAYEAYYLQKDNDVILDTNVSQNMTTPSRTIALDENGDKVPGLAKVLENVREGKKAEDFHQYLIYRHGLEWAEQGKRVFGDDTLDNADFMLSEIDRLDAQYPDFRGISEKLYAWQRRFMQEWLVNTGMITQETANMLWEKYPCYVPFFRRVDNTGTGVKRGFANQRAPIRRAKGSGLDLYDPVENIIVNMNSMIKSADRNRVAVEIADYVDQTEGSAYLMERVPPDMVKDEFRISEGYETRLKELLEGNTDNPDALAEAIMNMTSDDLSRWMVKNNQGKDVIWVMRNGQRQYYQVNNPELLIALNGMGPQQLNGIFKVTGALSRFLKTTTTGANFVWALGSNVFRDFQSAFQFSEENNFFKYTRDYVKSVASQIKKDEVYQAYKAAGGGYVSSISNPKAMSSILSKVYKQNGKDVRNLLNWVVKGLEAIETLSDVVETAPRLAEFSRVLDRTSNPRQAIRAADELTTNFKRRGSRSSQVESIIPYFNASVQGLEHLVRAFKSNPKGFAVKQILTSAIIAAFVIAWNRIWGGEDEYEEMSPYNKNNYYLFHIGDGKFLKIPKAREMSILESLFERTYERLVGRNDQAFLEFSDYIFDSLVPPGIPTPNDPKAPLKDLVLLGSFAEAWANEDYKGATIVPASLEDVEPYMQYNERTSAFAKAIGRLFNLSPMQIDYIMNSNTGLIGDIIISTTADQKDFTLGLGNKLISDVAYSGGATSKFYEDAEKAQVKSNSYPDNAEYKLLSSKYNSVRSILSKLTQYGKTDKGMERDLKLYAQELAGTFDTDLDPRLVVLYQRSGNTDIIPYKLFQNTATIDGQQSRLTPSEFIDYTEEYQSQIDTLYDGILSDQGLSDEEKVKALKKAKEDLSSSLKNKYYGGDMTYFDAVAEIGIDPVDYLVIYASQDPNPNGKFNSDTFKRSVQKSDLSDKEKIALLALYAIYNKGGEHRQENLERYIRGNT